MEYGVKHPKYFSWQVMARYKEANIAVMVKDKYGKAFRCSCGANVFTKNLYTDIYSCNGCNNIYEVI